jgi:hypothetical protein
LFTNQLSMLFKILILIKINIIEEKKLNSFVGILKIIILSYILMNLVLYMEYKKKKNIS